MKKMDGFIPLFWEESTGKLWMEVEETGKQFLYLISLASGLGSNEVGLDRNQLGNSRIVRFKKNGAKLFLVQANTSFRAENGSVAEQNAVTDAFAFSVLWGFDAAAEENGKALVDATAFLVRDAYDAAGSLGRGREAAYRFDSTRSAIDPEGLHNFPLNTEVETWITLTSADPDWSVRKEAADPGAVTFREHHSFIALPEDPFPRREYDPRSNFMALTYSDYSSPFQEPLQKRVAMRHRLKKRDPAAAVSPAVKPITYYVDPAIPEPIRSAVIEGAGWWNQAFEACGYRDAFRVEILPEGADPLDIRYNMINWVHRSSCGWSYGGSVIDPRNGEILKGHVSLGSLRIRQDFLIASALAADNPEGKTNCAELSEMALARIRQLACHEVGHTLGMGHNYASSVNDRASVMDYPHPLIRISGDGTLDLSDAYAKGIGEWDKVSIAWGYQDFPPGTDEKTALAKIIDDAFARGLIYLDSKDAGPGSAQPLAATWDNGPDPVKELERIMRIRAIALKDFGEKRIRPGMPLALLEDLLVPLYFFHRYQAEAAASVIGGVDYYHKLRGDRQAYPRIVDSGRQRQALNMLLRTLEPKFLALEHRILDLIPPRPPGFEESRELFRGRAGDLFDPLAAAESAADGTLSLLFHPHRMTRLVIQHARKPEMPGARDVIENVLDATWKTEDNEPYLNEIGRSVDTVVLARLFGLAASEETAPQARAEALQSIVDLKRWLSEKKGKEKAAAAHIGFGLQQIEEFLENPKAFHPLPVPEPPPGAPIGSAGEWEK